MSCDAHEAGCDYRLGDLLSMSPHGRHGSMVRHGMEVTNMVVGVRLAERWWTDDRTGRGEELRSVGYETAWTQPDGPWHHEPDKVQWLDLMTGYACLAVRGPLGQWCGYVGVPPGHRFHGVAARWVAKAGVWAYGGLNYSAPCDEGGRICHVPEPGQPAEVWWLGFICANGADLVPLAPIMPVTLPPRPAGWPEQRYRDLGFVQDMCACLAHQLAPKLLP